MFTHLCPSRLGPRSAILELFKINDFLTVTQAAQVLGVCPKTLKNWDRANKLKPLRHPVNAYRLYRREDLEAFLQRVTTRPLGQEICSLPE